MKPILALPSVTPKSGDKRKQAGKPSSLLGAYGPQLEAWLDRFLKQYSWEGSLHPGLDERPFTKEEGDAL